VVSAVFSSRYRSAPARQTERPDALDYLLRGRAVQGTGGVRENVEKAVDLFERALALDPSSVEAQSRLANELVVRATHRGPVAATADLRRAEELIAKALAASPSDAYTHRVKGFLLRITRRCEEAIPEFEIALATNRNDPNTLVHLSACKYLTGGSDKEAIALFERRSQPGQWRSVYARAARPLVDGVLPWYPRRRIAGRVSRQLDRA
jgi:tetratricopeptide (TPR) repeat protein